MGIDIGEAYGSAINYNFLIYSNIVCEIALFLNLFNCDNINIDFDEMEKNYQYIKILDDFFEIVDRKEPVLKDTQWY